MTEQTTATDTHKRHEADPDLRSKPVDVEEGEAAANVACPDTHTNTTAEELRAANALMRLRKDGAKALRRLVNTHHSHMGRAVASIISQAIHHPLDGTKTAEHVERDERYRLRRRKVSTALSLIKLSGQSTADIAAALTLHKLRTESKLALQYTRQERNRAEGKVLREKGAAEQLVAMEKFRRQYPAVLRTSRRRGGATSSRPQSSLLYVVTHHEDQEGES